MKVLYFGWGEIVHFPPPIPTKEEKKSSGCQRWEKIEKEAHGDVGERKEASKEKMFKKNKRQYK